MTLSDVQENYRVFYFESILLIALIDADNILSNIDNYYARCVLSYAVIYCNVSRA
jgi:hypothetical protein